MTCSEGKMSCNLCILLLVIMVIFGELCYSDNVETVLYSKITLINKMCI